MRGPPSQWVGDTRGHARDNMQAGMRGASCKGHVKVKLLGVLTLTLRQNTRLLHLVALALTLTLL